MDKVERIVKLVLKSFATVMWLMTLVASIYFAVEVMDWIVLHLWNFTVPGLFGLPEMHHYQGVAFMTLLNLLIGKPSYKACKKMEKELIKPLKTFWVEIDSFRFNVGEAKAIGKREFFSSMERVTSHTTDGNNLKRS